jgi:predicted transcriptional regulator YdeE
VSDRKRAITKLRDTGPRTRIAIPAKSFPLGAAIVLGMGVHAPKMTTAVIVATCVAAVLVGGNVMFFGHKKSAVPEPKIVVLEKPYIALGMSARTGIKTLVFDLPKLYKRYLGYKKKLGIPGMREPWEYVSVSRDFRDDSSWEYCTGYVVDRADEVPAELVRFEAPIGRYAVFPIRGASRLTFGAAVGRMKRYIYTEWIPARGYRFGGIEFEYNNEAMSAKHPYDIDLYVAVEAAE